MSEETPAQQEQKRLQQNAQALLEKTLKDNDRLYTKFLKPDDALTKEYIEKLFSILKEENDLNAKLKAKGWLSWGKAFVKTDPDYDVANKQNAGLVQQKQQLITEYLEKTQVESAKELAEKIQINTKEMLIIPPLQAPLSKQIALSEVQVPEEVKIDAFGREIPGDDSSAKPKDYDKKAAEITEEYRKILIEQGAINQFLSNQFDAHRTLQDNYPEQIKLLTTKFAQAYAEYTFAKAEQLIPRKADATINREELNKQASVAEHKKDFALKKIMLLCEFSKYYKTDPSNQNKIDINSLTKEIESITSQNIQEWTQAAEKAFYATPGSYMLSEQEKQQFMSQLFLQEAIAAKLSLTPKEQHESQKTMNSILIQSAKSYADKYTYETAATDHVLDKFIEKDAGIMSWSTGTNNSLKDQQQQRTIKSRDDASKQLRGIKGYNFLDKSEQQYFINMLSILKEKETLEQDQQYKPVKWIRPFKEVEISDCIKDIEKSINKHFEQDPTVQNTINRLETEYNIKEISSIPLQNILKKQLSEAIVNGKKAEHGVKPLPDTETDLLSVKNKIEIAKVLDKNESFKNYTVAEQLEYIKKLTSSLNQINKIQNEITEKELAAKQDPTNATYAKEIERLKNALKEEEHNIQETMNNITLSKSLANARKDLEIPEDPSGVFGAIKGGIKYVKNILSKPMVQDGIAGAFIAVTAALAKGTINPTSLLATAAAGAAVGTQVKARYIFKPFQILYNEISDIVTKPKSYIDRIFRGGAILGSTLAMAVGIGVLVAAAANPFSGPVVAGVIVGAVATVAVAAATAKFAGWASKKMGLDKFDFYQPTKEAVQLFGEQNKAEQVSSFLKKEIENLEQQLKLSGKSAQDKELIQTQITAINHTWRNLQKGNDSSWEDLLKLLTEIKMNKCKEQVQAIGKQQAAEITSTLLDLVKTDKSKVQDDSATTKLVAVPIKKTLSFAEHQQAIKTLDNDMKELLAIKKVMPSKK